MEWHFDYSAEDLAAASNDRLRGNGRPADPEPPSAKDDDDTPELDGYRLNILRLVARDASAAALESGDNEGLAFSPWIEGLLRGGDENRYAADPPLRSLVLRAIALRLKIQDDIESARKTKEALSEKLAEDLKLAARTINDLQAYVASADRGGDGAPSKEILRLKFSLHLRQTRLQDYLTGERDRLPAESSASPQARRVESSPPSRRTTKEATPRTGAAKGGPPAGPGTGQTSSETTLVGKCERPGIFGRIRSAVRSFGLAPILLVLTASFFLILHYTGGQTARQTDDELQQQPTSPYQQEIKFKQARCDDKTFFGVVTEQWNSLKPAQKMEALLALRKKLLSDGVQAGILTKDNAEKVASWDLEQASLNE